VTGRPSQSSTEPIVDPALEALLRRVVREEIDAALSRHIATAPSPPPTYTTVEQAATALMVAPKTVRAGVQRGKLRALRVGRQLRIPRQELDRFPTGGVDSTPVDTDKVANTVLMRGRRAREK
jgi:excisionase family DNA binding protein